MKRFINILLIATISATILTGCTNEKVIVEEKEVEKIEKVKEKPQAATKEHLGLDKKHKDLKHNYFRIVDAKEGKVDRLLKSDDIIKEVVEFSNSYILETKNFSYKSFTGKEEEPFLSKGLKQALNSLEDKEKKKEEKLIEEVKKDLEAKRVFTKVVKLEEPEQIIISPNKDKAAVFIKYLYTLRSEDLAIEEEDDRFGTSSNMLILSLVKEDEEWKLDGILDANSFGSVDIDENDIDELQNFENEFNKERED